MKDTETIRRFYQRLNHKCYGVTELVIIDPNGKGITATGFFNDESALILTQSDRKIHQRQTNSTKR